MSRELLAEYPQATDRFDELLVDHEVGRRRLDRAAEPARVPPRQAVPERFDETRAQIVGDRARGVGHTIATASDRAGHER